MLTKDACHILVKMLLQITIVLSTIGLVCDRCHGNEIITQFDEVTESDFAFPEDFQFGCATAAFQVEGAWNESGKGENIWDRLIHSKPDLVTDLTNADVACDSYHKFKEDVAALKTIGVNFYRFSISWSRVLPTGDASVINEEGIQYYSDLIDELLRNGIEPMVTLFHWDVPQPLQEFGGFINPLIATYYTDYARLMFQRLGDRVKTWITFNEPTEQCLNGYVNMGAPPMIEGYGVGEYLCAHHVLISHANAYRVYEIEFKAKQKGRVGITLVQNYFYPKTNTSEDIEAAERAMQFMIGWYAHPIFSKRGNYPKVMIDNIQKASDEQHRIRSRLPVMDEAMIDHIKGTADFLGLNHYTSRLASNAISGKPNTWYTDQKVKLESDPSWPSAASSWLKVVPEGFRKLLKWVQNEYPGIEIIVTENGYSDHGQLDDHDRVHYICSYLNEMLKAIIIDNCNVKGYALWSIIDNFEWLRGFTERFGIYYVNITDPERTRIPKESSRTYNKIISTRKIPKDCLIDHIYSFN